MLLFFFEGLMVPGRVQKLPLRHLLEPREHQVYNKYLGSVSKRSISLVRKALKCARGRPGRDLVSEVTRPPFGEWSPRLLISDFVAREGWEGDPFCHVALLLTVGHPSYLPTRCTVCLSRIIVLSALNLHTFYLKTTR